MQAKNYIQSKMHYFGIIMLALLLTSCGSYRYAGYEDDAIYGESERYVEYVERAGTEEEAESGNGYYKNYFKEKALQYEGIEENAVFTDVDSYEGSYEVQNDSIRYTESYAGWGQDHNQDVSINIYGGHLYNSIWWNRPWGWNAGWGWGYNNWGWNAGWGWNYGFGWNYWDPFWCPPYYGGFWGGYAGFWGGYWGSPYYYGGWPYYGHSYGYAYNAGRRGSIYQGRRSSYSNRSLASLGRRGGLDAYTGRRSSINQGRLNPNNSTVRPSSTRVRPSATPRQRPGINSRPAQSGTRPAVTNPRTRPSSKARPNARPGTRPKARPNTKPRTRPNAKPRGGNSNSRPAYSRPSSSNRSRSINRSGSRSRSSGFSRSSGSSRSSGASRSSGSRRGGRF